MKLYRIFLPYYINLGDCAVMWIITIYFRSIQLEKLRNIILLLLNEIIIYATAMQYRETYLRFS